MAPSDEPRTPLGLPAGSVRAIIALITMIELWVLMLLPELKAVSIPLNLYFLLAMVGIFFVSHGSSIAERSVPQPSPLGLPGGSVRLIIIAGTVAVMVFVGLNHPERFQRLIPKTSAESDWHYWLYLLGATTGFFTVGHVLKMFSFKNGYVFQTFKAWASLLAIGSMLIETILQATVYPTLATSVNLGWWEVVVTAVVAFYYGIRS